MRSPIIPIRELIRKALWIAVPDRNPQKSPADDATIDESEPHAPIENQSMIRDNERPFGFLQASNLRGRTYSNPEAQPQG